jgi:7-cyano-7-deazaguanine synthase
MSVAIVLLSGGIDSTTALYWALRQGFTVGAITYNYHRRPSRELEAARKIAYHAGVNCLEIELPFLQTAADIVRENSATFKGVEVPEGYIPSRNLIFYAIAAYYAEIHCANYIVGGHLQTDSIGFPDASPTFFLAIERLINSSRLDNESNDPRVRLLMPFLQRSKTDVVKMASELELPLELTWSCYYDRDDQCRECVSCLERADAFAEAGLIDPLKENKKKP